MRTCSIPGCEREYNCRGWCQAHYKLWQKHGDPLGESFPWPGRFWAKVAKSEGCWVWTGAFGREGYGRTSDGKGHGRIALSHRVSYELEIGPIPDGLHIDHLCRNRACVRPSHLEPVTQAENNRRSATKSVCVAGHPMVDPNLYYRSDGRRECRECCQRRAREYDQRRAERARA